MGVYENMFLLVPGAVCDPVTSTFTPSLPTNPSSEAVTLLFVSALPSYSLLSVADVSVTFLFVIE